MRDLRGPRSALGARFLPLALVIASLATVRADSQRPQFSASTLVVPVNVRVVGRDGQPISDLTQTDFAVLEDGVPQVVSLFQTYDFRSTSEKATEASARPDGGSTVGRRVFLIVLGRGRLEHVSHGLSAAADFVQRQLRPTDLVAVMAWNRASPFTTDHARVASLLQQLLPVQDSIEQDLSDWFGGLRGLYGAKEVPPSITKKVDRVFDGMNWPTESRQDMALTELDRSDPATGEVMGALQEAARASGTANSAGQRSIKSGEFDAANMAAGGRTLDDYVTVVTKADQDVSKLYAGVEFLRRVEGEKHLIFLTESGLALSSVEKEKDLASRASDARVALDVIQTGGAPGTDPFETMNAAVFDPVPNFSISALERYAELTGGIASIYSYASKGFTAVANESAFEYLLGYRPTNQTIDGRFRRIEVQVRRPGVDALYRRGYFATPLPAMSERQLFAYTQILTVARHPRQDFKLTAAVDDVRLGDQQKADVHVSVDPAHLEFVERDGKQVASLDLAIFCSFSKSHQTTWHTVDLAKSADSKSGAATFTIRLAVNERPRQVLVVVYQFEKDVVSAAYARRP